MLHPRRSRPLLAATLALSLASCAGLERGGSADAEFLLAAGDSTFWIRSDREGISVRRSPLLLARIDGRFHELYVTDDDRSFYDAVLVGQRVYRRDLLSGDSTLLLDDPRVAVLARDYALARPDETPLGPDDEASPDPHTVATIEIELLDVFGRYVSFAHHLDVDIVNGEETHRTRRGVLDLAAGGEVSLATLLGVENARRVVATGRASFDATVDSVLAASGSGARRAAAAAAAIREIRFDSSSFALVDDTGGIAVSFFPLPLTPIAVQPPAWWKEHAAEVPSRGEESGTDRWRTERYVVLARYDSTGDGFTLAIRHGTAEKSAGRFPAPSQRLYRLDQPPIDSTTREALGRAFDASAFYSGETRVAGAPRTGAATVTPAAADAGRTPRAVAVPLLPASHRK